MGLTRPRWWWWWHDQGKGGGLIAAAAAVGGGVPSREPHLRRKGVGSPIRRLLLPHPYEPWKGEGRGGLPPFLRLDGGRTGEAVAHWPAAGGPPGVVSAGGGEANRGELHIPTRGSTSSPSLCSVNKIVDRPPLSVISTGTLVDPTRKESGSAGPTRLVGDQKNIWTKFEGISESGIRPGRISSNWSTVEIIVPVCFMVLSFYGDDC
ncbi:hypothetical protein Sjap_017086 [Stephania japonica]|uniref:Uncharacterized protein n=1 Tax=Stephania japonica TaxID=461633 RepID=A0AAP0I5H7_9MAGN